MMLLVPILSALIPGIIILTLTWLLNKKGLSIYVRMFPGVLAMIAALIIFYVGFVTVRGFEGGAYGILSFILFIFSIISLFMGIKYTKVVR
jgi:hypothetical protein